MAGETGAGASAGRSGIAGRRRMNLTRRTLGATGVEVSIVGLGAARLGRTAKLKAAPFRLPATRQARWLPDRARELGVNLIDAGTRLALAPRSRLQSATPARARRQRRVPEAVIARLISAPLAAALPLLAHATPAGRAWRMNASGTAPSPLSWFSRAALFAPARCAAAFPLTAALAAAGTVARSLLALAVAAG